MPQNYSDKLKDHYKNPRNTGKLADFTHTAEQINPLCGDETIIYINFSHSDLIIQKISHETRGCMIAVAAASVVSEYACGKKLSEIIKFEVNDMEKLLGISISPARQNCANLFLEAVRKLQGGI